jgi:hypothetical protein
VHPNFPGVPWWGAVLLAGTFTAVGFAFDAGSGDRQLSAVFSACYVLGCLLAVLAVRQNSVFTAVIQPPLILFASVPGAYFLFHGGQLSGLKDLAINCGYPLIERFPLMFFTAATVLLIGMGRWYLGMSARRGAPAAEAKDTEATKPKRSRRRAAVDRHSQGVRPHRCGRRRGRRRGRGTTTQTRFRPTPAVRPHGRR